MRWNELAVGDVLDSDFEAFVVLRVTSDVNVFFSFDTGNVISRIRDSTAIAIDDRYRVKIRTS